MSPLFGGGKKNDAPSGPRTAAEREAARLERERRRAERNGTPDLSPPNDSVNDSVPGTLSQGDSDFVSGHPAGGSDPLSGGDADLAPPGDPVREPPPPVFDEPTVVRYEHHAPPPADDEAVPPEPTYEAAPPDPTYEAAPPDPTYEAAPPEPVYEAAPPEPVYEVAPPEPVYEAAPPEPAYEAVPPEPVYEPDAEPAYEPEPEYDPEHTYEFVPEPERVTVPAEAEAEQPAPLRRVGAPSVRDLPQVAGARPVGVAPRTPPRKRRWRARLFMFVVLILLAGVAYLGYRVLQPGHGDGDAARPVRVTVPRGATAGEVADLLEQRGVIDSAFFFGLRARLDGKRDQLKAGTFALKADMSYQAALATLTTTPKPPPVVKLTIPEGRSIAEETPRIADSGLKGSYRNAAARNPRTVKGFRSYGVPRGTRTMEGFLFPATYELKRDATARDLVDQQLAAFRRTFDPLDQKAAQRKNLSAYDVLIIASMIEREAQVPKDRALISAVIYNRLKQHMPLGIDATLRYRLDNWSRPLRQSELKADSAFNTRTRQGLPPTPIGSPGLASIKAALKPAHVPYLFYVVKPCGNGAHAFSAGDAQFQKDVAAYNRKRDQLGGKDPSHC